MARMSAVPDAIPCRGAVAARCCGNIAAGRSRASRAPALAADLATVSDAALPQDDLVAAIPRLRRYARVLAGDAAAADDLVAETLARAWEKRRLWQAGTDLRAWLFTIMHNVSVNQRAAARRESHTVSIDNGSDGGEALQLPVRAMQQTRVELIELMREVARLPGDQREVLLLAAVEELRYEEIATVLGIPIGTVMSRLSRAREKLRRSAAAPGAALRAIK